MTRWLLGVVAAVCVALCLAACTSQTKAPVVDRSVARDAVETRPSTPDSYVVRRKDTLYSIAYRHELDYRALAAANGIEPPFLIKPGQRIRLAEAPVPPPSRAPRAEPTERVPPRATPVRIAPADLTVETKRAPATEPAPSKPPAAAPPEPARKAPALSAPPAPSAAVAAPRPAKPAASAPPPTSNRRDGDGSVRAADDAGAAKAPAAGQAGWRRPVAARPVRRFGAGSKGFDYELPAATRIRSATAGVVVYAGPGIGGFRHLVIVKASEKHLVAYGVNVQPLLGEGEEVPAGAVVAEVPGNGKASGRFHFEIRDGGKPVDPGPFIGA